MGCSGAAIGSATRSVRTEVVPRPCKRGHQRERERARAFLSAETYGNVPEHAEHKVNVCTSERKKFLCRDKFRLSVLSGGESPEPVLKIRAVD